MFYELFFFGDVSQVFFNRILAMPFWCERRYPYIKGCDSSASQKILWKQVVTCLGYSKKHFKTNLAEYWGVGGCTVG